jgi:hypothetical protein
VHYLAYVCWPIAVLHGLGSGSDARLSIMVLIEVVCIASVVSAVAWRLVAARGLPNSRRLAAAGATVALVIGIGVFALFGPLQPGWSRRAGTSAPVLAEINARFATKTVGSASGSTPSTTVPSTTTPSSRGVIPASPFTANVTGTIKTSNQNSAGEVEVLLSMQLQGSNASLVVKLIGTAVNGGVSMSSSSVALGTEQGTVTALDGSTIGATVRGPSGRIDLDMQLSISQSTGSITGTVSGTSRNEQ